MSKQQSVEGRETDGKWRMAHRSYEEKSTPISGAHNGQELQPMVVDMLQAVGAGALATQVEGLTVVAEPTYEADHRRTWKVSTAQSGNFVVRVTTTDVVGDGVVTGDFVDATYGDFQSAVVGLTDLLGAPVFSAQIAAL